MEQIRNVRPGDEDSLAYVQTESWKAAFREIVPADILAECTALESTAAIYRRILDEGFGNGYLMELDGKPHCIAWWSVARDANMAGYAELICLHSLQENWHKGYGRAMMERVLADVKKAGYEKLVLWVFENNTRAIQFYKSFGFEPSGRRRPALGAVEEMCSKPL
jgi:GNAT superfamily N-acetyltransferase